MTERQKIVEYAISQIGTAENPLGSNKQKYGAFLDSTNWYLYKSGDKEWIHKVNSYDWCTQFVDSAFIILFSIDRARKMLNRPQYNNYGAVVKYAYNYFYRAEAGFPKAKYTPKPGDVIYFQNDNGLSHTGIVIEVSDSKVTTVEGNSGTNGYYVAKKTYNKTSSYIYGYGYPNYSTEPEPSKYTVGDTYNVLCDELEIRKGPGTSYGSVGQLKHGAKIVCKAVTTDSAGNTWMQGAKGWSAAIYNSNTYIGNIGWVQKNGKWYYYDDKGNLLINSWIKYKGGKYYAGKDGALLTGWQTIANNNYYFAKDTGLMAQDEWVDGLFLNMDGTQTYSAKGVWKSDSKGKWWQDSTGWYPVNRAVMIDGKICKFNTKGYLS